MASLLKRKGKKKSTAVIQPEESVPAKSGSQLSVREAAKENTADNTASESELSQNDEILLRDDASATVKSKGKSGGGKKGAKPAWRGGSLEKSGPNTKGKTSTVNEIAGPSHGGSTTSVTSKEAWSNEKNKQKGSVVSLSKADKDERNSYDGDTKSISNKSLVVKRGDNQSQQHAYVPYLYARNCVARVTNDMKAMKEFHVTIVRDIETNYRMIEDETQSQFNTYVLLLRTEYSGKVKNFRQVIETHRAELEQKEQYWNNMLKSLTDRNNQLLNDKKALLIKNKVEIDKLENEKKETTEELMKKLELSELLAAQVGEEKKVEIEKTQSELHENLKYLELEKQGLVDQLKSKEAENVELQQQLSEKSQTMGVGVVRSTDVRSERDGSSDIDANQLETRAIQSDKIHEERTKIQQEREEMLAERDRLISSEENLRLRLSRLQDNLTDSKKELAEWKGKYSVVSNQYEEVGGLREAYQILKDQYNALATVAIVTSSSETKATAQENLTKTESEVTMMKEAKEETNNEILKWEKEFQEKEGRPPIEADKSDSVKEMYTSREEVNLMLESLDRKKETLKKLGSGEVPSVQPVPHTALVTAEPVVTTVEVEVPDPKTLEELESSQLLVTQLQGQLTDLRTENRKLQGETTDLEVELSDVRDELDDLKNTPTLSSGDSEEFLNLQTRVNSLEKDLVEERLAHDRTKEELDAVSAQLRVNNDELLSQTLNLKTQLNTTESTLKAEITAKNEELRLLETRLDELEKERLSKIPPDSAKEIKQLTEKLRKLKKEKSESSSAIVLGEAKLKAVQDKLEASVKNLEVQRTATTETEAKLKKFHSDNEKTVHDLTAQLEKKEQQRLNAEKALNNLQKKSQNQSGGKGKAVVAADVSPGDSGLKRENIELRRRVKELEAEIKRLEKSGGVIGKEGSTADRQTMKKNEKILKELEKKLDLEMRKREKHEQNLKIREEELSQLQKESDNDKRELQTVRGEMSALGVSAKEGLEAAAQVKQLQGEVKKLQEDNKVLSDNFNSERVLRKKYYNMVEDMKGKIRVYCRTRPLSTTEKGNGNREVVASPDEYSVQVQSSRGLRDFQFDQIFMPQDTQEKVFEDTNNLIQSAVDGYNVCIFAYGQTGSGKTFTMIGDQGQKFPGIAPRAFSRIFEILDENQNKYSFKVTSYMMELYNDHLIDLYGQTAEGRLDIKKDQQGMVFVTGAAVKQARNSKELYALFEEGSKNRHVASTKMNAESSRSHLVLAVMIESTNKGTGQVTRGKLSLVDLAGSERVGKTEATAEQLKEAMSINKSLSALSNVISALSSEQSFIPYRDNKLTMLMQDSLGGNAKTLMFVNISPADYNCDESIISLQYASRVKLITNAAQKNADNKEIARLKDIINKLKQGENIEEEV